ncbi:prolyl oligopeptidase family serine peptidase [Pedobacter sp. MC2016-14]|uniref:alpha/beta hydrolase family protein n=1 Tax=Pedobacter sp. MC2016-14 TaxID=2897327 RepID=UPI001E4D6A55|nr:prolyl oligopeptidase family serine peptidase [Pedobacter sp. MC2016-14]MCD0488972.1 prolyl oligopeptidase family serine peptidase [Pedobacter sp. MC2016-14]
MIKLKLTAAWLVFLCLSTAICVAGGADNKRDTTFNIFKYITAEKTFTDFHGYRCASFKLEGRNCRIVAPKWSSPGRPYIWRARFWNTAPEAEIRLLALGYHVVYCDVSELYGNSAAVGIWNNFYQFLLRSGLSHKAVLEGMSRGGVYVYNWAAENPEKVACVYADNPVVDLKSWPGGKGKGPGSKNDWSIVKKDFNLSTREEEERFSESPIDKVRQIVAGGYPMLHVLAMEDEVVPIGENTLPFAEKIKALGGNLKIIEKPGFKHHPHGIADPTQVVDFIVKAVDRATATVKSAYVLDMVHNNPGEKLTKSDFNDPKLLKQHGYGGMVINDFTFAHAAITYDSFDKRIFPKGSAARAWVMEAAAKVRANIKRAHSAGIKVYYFTDIIVLPKKLVDLYRDEICDSNGKISFERPKTIAIHKAMLNEVFDAFPDLDGLVIRTGETYLNNVPYHTGNNPITNAEESHVKLLNLLHDEVCVKRNKEVIYRTWSFGDMHESAEYYLKVMNRIIPHPNLVISIKHTKGDYHRTFDFNPTLGIGAHRQIVEVQCQREYEGKGAYPNYVMNGVIEGFEEYGLNRPQKGYNALNGIKNTPQFAGIWSWSRGGGWVGPYISNEFWCRLNAYVISYWAQHTNFTEEEVFNIYMDQQGIKGKSRIAFRQLCLLSARAVLRGHDSVLPAFDAQLVWWMRDEFLGGTDSDPLDAQFKKLYEANQLDASVEEKFEAVRLWEQIVDLSKQINVKNAADTRYINVSSRYGLLLHQIIAQGWRIMALGYKGDLNGKYDKVSIRTAIASYDSAWQAYKKLKEEEASCATLYKPYVFVYQAPSYHGDKGLGSVVEKYRKITANQ